MMSNVPSPTDRRTLLQNALRSLDEMQAKLDAVERTRSEPIAIVGMSCRFPGGADSPEAYWSLLRDGVDAVGELSDERLALLGHLDESIDRSMLQGGFLSGIEGFDPQFFGMAPREASSLDPQQRLVLEASWEALERAGIAPDGLTGSATGVYIGISTNDYGQLLGRGGTDLDVYAATGGALNAGPGRVAFTLGLRGPALAVDTACSSSLVAVHLAVQSLRGGECDMALAGGVNVTLLPEAFVCFTGWGMLAADARCKTFDASADGFVRGEGCGMLVLKRLSDALAAGDPVLAVVRGSAVNNDGRSAGITVPNGAAQRAVIQAALQNACVEPAQIQYVEAHGTGTSLGDPIEVEAIGAALGPGRGVEIPLLLGSVKTNLGHLESAAGMAGLIKIVLMLQHGQIPPHLHLLEPSPRIPWPDFPIEIPTTLSPWPKGDGPRLAGVSGFGLTGTNAHVVLEEAPARAPVAAQHTRPRQPLVISARSETALRELAGRYSKHLGAYPEQALADVAATASCGRAQLPHRLALSAATGDEAAGKLAAFAAGEAHAGLVAAQTSFSAKPRAVFLFTGQGAQYAGMGRELYETQPVFRNVLDRCATLLTAYLDQPLLDVMFAAPDSPAAGLLDQTAYTQPALFALEYALAELWRSWGIAPAAVLGHSIGEYAAACVAGVLGLEDALRLVAARGRLMGSLPAGGAMAAAFASEEQVRAAIAPFSGQVSIAALNGPTHTVISGEEQAVKGVSAALGADGVRVRPLTVSHAFHSPLMEPILAEFEAAAREATYGAPRIPLVANLTGRPWPSDAAPDADYWRRHLREPVQFAPSLAALHNAGYDLFLEIGPHPVLAGMGRECAGGDEANWLASLRRGRDDWETILDALGRLYIAGAAVDWERVTTPYASQRVDLPTYPFQRQRYWTEAATRRRTRHDPDEHPLLGRRLRSPLARATMYEARVSDERPAYLSDHRIYGTPIFPGSAFIELALAAAADTSAESELLRLDRLELQAPLALPTDGSERLLQFALVPDGPSAYSFQIGGLNPDDDNFDSFVIHATGEVRVAPADSQPTWSDAKQRAATLSEEIDVDDYYAKLAAVGLDYGPAFRGLAQLRCADGVAVGLVRLPPMAEDSPRYQIHPAQLDACFHVVGAALPEAEQGEEVPYVPVEVKGLQLFRRAPADIWCVAELTPSEELPAGSLAVRLSLYAEDGEPVAEVERLLLKRAPRAAWSRVLADDCRDWFYRLAWTPETAAPDVPSEPGAWLIFTDGEGLGDALARRLTELGATVTTVAARGAKSNGRLSADPTDPDAPERVLSALPSGQSLTGVVYLWGLDTSDDVHDSAALPGALHLAQALIASPHPPPRLWLVTSGAVAVDGDPAPMRASSAMLWGFGRTLMAEQPGLNCTCLDLDQAAASDAGRLAELLLLADDENEIALRGERRYVARLERETEHAARALSGPYRLQLSERGALDKLSVVPLERRTPGPGEVEVATRASGLNFRDVLNVLGMYPGEPPPPGSECAGVITAVGPDVAHLRPGDEVVALSSGSFDSHVIVRADLVFPKPAALSFAEAAAVPSAYMAAAYGLLHLAKLQPGDRVLIHAAAGGVGLAAVHIAMSRGAEVFATVGSPAKRAFLAKLGVQHIFSSRTLDFTDEILAVTGGAGVDIVLNSLADAFIERSLAALAPDGCFLELGKRGVWSPEEVAAVRPAASYHIYDLGEVLLSQPGVLEELLSELLEEIADRRLPLVPVRAFAAPAYVDAFRHMAQARHIGKVVVVHRPEESRGVRSDGSYLVTGGLGGLGLETASWLVERGAGAVALLGRNEPTPRARERIAELERGGAQVLVLRGDVSSAPDVAAALDVIDRELPPLKGVFHLAGTTDDGELSQQSWSRVESVLAPKATGALHLDRLTRQYDLDHFVLYSSASAVLGSPGQSGYTAANAVLDALAHERQALGRPALSIDWSAWEEVGMAAALSETHKRRLSERGMGTITLRGGLAALEIALGFDRPQLVIMPARWDILARRIGPHAQPPLLRTLLDGATPSAPRSGAHTILERLAGATPEERAALVHEHLRAVVSAALGLAQGQIDPNQPLTDLGLDSLMAVEVRNGASSAFGIALSPADILDGASTTVLANRVVALLSGEAGTPGGESVQTDTDPEAAATAELLANLDKLSDDQVDELLSLIAVGDQRDDVSDLTVGRA